MMYAIYEKTTGRIKWSIECPHEFAAAQETDELGVIEGAELDGMYVTGDPPALTPREAMPVVQDGSRWIAPAGVAWRVECAELGIDEAGVDDDGDLTIEFEDPGAYRVTLSLWPYLDYVAEVSV